MDGLLRDDDDFRGLRLRAFIALGLAFRMAWGIARHGAIRGNISYVRTRVLGLLHLFLVFVDGLERPAAPPLGIFVAGCIGFWLHCYCNLGWDLLLLLLFWLAVGLRLLLLGRSLVFGWLCLVFLVRIFILVVFLFIFGFIGFSGLFGKLILEIEGDSVVLLPLTRRDFLGGLYRGRGLDDSLGRLLVLLRRLGNWGDFLLWW